jgi:hypothetical protein
MFALAKLYIGGVVALELAFEFELVPSYWDLEVLL